jgi:hypothetical protein
MDASAISEGFFSRLGDPGSRRGLSRLARLGLTAGPMYCSADGSPRALIGTEQSQTMVCPSEDNPFRDRNRQMRERERRWV